MGRERYYIIQHSTCGHGDCYITPKKDTHDLSDITYSMCYKSKDAADRYAEKLELHSGHSHYFVKEYEGPEESDLDEIKYKFWDIASIPIMRTEFDFIISHPCFSSPYFFVDESKMLNLLNEDEFKEAVSIITQRVWRVDSVFSIASIYINKPYRLFFLKQIKRYLCEKDFAELLKFCWQTEDAPSQDVNVPLLTIAKWFRAAGKNLIMDESELGKYNALGNTVRVYRGVGVGRAVNGLSYTTSLETAEWFAKRWDTDTEHGYVQYADIPKEYVLAVFEYENEVVCDTFKMRKYIKRYE